MNRMLMGVVVAGKSTPVSVWLSATLYQTAQRHQGAPAVS